MKRTRQINPKFWGDPSQWGIELRASRTPQAKRLYPYVVELNIQINTMYTTTLFTVNMKRGKIKNVRAYGGATGESFHAACLMGKVVP